MSLTRQCQSKCFSKLTQAHVLSYFPPRAISDLLTKFWVQLPILKSCYKPPLCLSTLSLPSRRCILCILRPGPSVLKPYWSLLQVPVASYHPSRCVQKTPTPPPTPQKDFKSNTFLKLWKPAMCVNDVVNLRRDIYTTHTLAILGIISEEPEVKKDQSKTLWCLLNMTRQTHSLQPWVPAQDLYINPAWERQRFM